MYNSIKQIQTNKPTRSPPRDSCRLSRQNH
nr:MAG TPA: hypothetical protein [Caudoviricetes sp.]DAV93631.1 MAG TPA: hypothetical protein [Caudoviricetes sp.]DAZ79315.1 MAG TPA: hypothetical protein [Caudoviricetes sp.]